MQRDRLQISLDLKYSVKIGRTWASCVQRIIFKMNLLDSLTPGGVRGRLLT